MRKRKLSEALRMAIAKDIDELDGKEPKENEPKKEPKLAVEAEPEHFEDCTHCVGGLDGDKLCEYCAGSGKALPST